MQANIVITFHLINGKELSESYHDEYPAGLWKEIVDEFSEISEAIEIQPMDSFAQVLLPKSSILFISMKVEP